MRFCRHRAKVATLLDVSSSAAFPISVGGSEDSDGWKAVTVTFPPGEHAPIHVGALPSPMQDRRGLQVENLQNQNAVLRAAVAEIARRAQTLDEITYGIALGAILRADELQADHDAR